MKIAILSDIHGNMAALEAVAADIDQWGADQIFVNGDTVNRGACSPQTWRFVQQRGWAHTLGNHEMYISARLDKAYPPDKRYVPLFAMSQWTFGQFNGELQAMAALPEEVSWFAPDGSECRLRHASMHSITDSVTADSSLERIRDQIAPPPALFATAHIHEPFVRQVDQTLVVNSGSVGQPCDGDLRASYARVTWKSGKWAAKIARVAYDRARAEANFRASGFLEGAGAVARLVYREWHTGQKCVTRWRRQYETAVLDGEIDVETAVEKFLQDDR